MKKTLSTIRNERIAQQRRDLARAQKLRDEKDAQRRARKQAEDRQALEAVRALGGVMCERCQDKGFIQADTPVRPVQNALSPPLPNGVAGVWTRVIRCPDCPPAAREALTTERWGNDAPPNALRNQPNRWVVTGKPVRGPMVRVDFSKLEEHVLSTLVPEDDE